MKHGKKYQDSVKLIDHLNQYDPDQAAQLVVSTGKAKFDETVEVSIRLGVDPRHADQQVRGAVVLPSIHKIGATRTICDNHIGVIWLHGFKFFVGIGERVSSVALDKVLSESKSAAMSSFRVIYNFSSPCLNHSGKDIGIFRSSESFRGKHLSIVTSNMFYNSQRFACFMIDQFEFCLNGNLIPEFIYDIAGVRKIFWFNKFQFTGIPKILLDLCLKFRKFMPCLQCFCIDSE